MRAGKLKGNARVWAPGPKGNWGDNAMIHTRRFERIQSAVPGTSLLPIPFAIAAGSLVLLAATLSFDALTRAGDLAPHSWLSVGDIDDARAILGAILGAVSTVLALIFSATLLVFSMAVTQFGPRLMPYFLRDRTMQVALGLFLGTFLQCLGAFLVTGRRGQSVFVPQLTVLTSVLLVFVSFCFLVFYNHRVAFAIQTNNVLARIIENLHTAIGEHSQRRVFQVTAASSPDLGKEVPQAIRERCLEEGGVLYSQTSGYVQKLDRERLVRAAEKQDGVVCLMFRPGQFVLEGEALAHVIPASHAEEFASVIHQSVRIGQHRTLEQDLEFAFAQLSEIAIRALSPAVNDTYTGLSCIDWLGDALRMFAALPSSDGEWRTNLGAVRVLVPPLHFPRVVAAALDLIRQAGAENPAVMIRLLQTCARLARQLQEEGQRRAIQAQVQAIHEAAVRFPDVHVDRNDLEDAYRLACDALEKPLPVRRSDPAA
jgi:uncharacterized membrane protein